MDRNRLIGIARMYMGQQKSHRARERGFVFHHGLRVAKLSLVMAEKHPEGNTLAKDIIFAGGLFHDIAKGEEPHNETGALRVMTMLNGVCRPDELQEIANMILLHNCRQADNELPLDAQIIQDADILDHMGAQMVWLSLFWSAGHDRPPEETIEYYRSDEHQQYLLQLRNKLNLPLSITEFDHRRQLQDSFSRHLACELEGCFTESAAMLSQPASGVAQA